MKDKLKKILHGKIKTGNEMIVICLVAGAVSIIDFIKPKTDILDGIGLFLIALVIWFMVQATSD